MTVDELFERISKVHVGETDASIGCNLEPEPCPNWFWRLEWEDRYTLTMIDFFFVEEMGFNRANYNNLTPYAEGDPIATRYYKCRHLRRELGSYSSNQLFLQWTSTTTRNAYYLHLLTGTRHSDLWIYSKFDLDIFLTWGAAQL